jgi:hypothetical protein
MPYVEIDQRVPDRWCTCRHHQANAASLTLGAPVSMGSRPRDDGQLIIEEADYHLVENDPVAMRYVRPLRGNRELLHNKNPLRSSLSKCSINGGS